MAIPFTQFLRPNARRRTISVMAAEDVEKKAHNLIARGCRFEAEVLSTGIVHFSVEITKAGEDEVLANALCENGPVIEQTIEKLVEEAWTILGKDDK